MIFLKGGSGYNEGKFFLGLTGGCWGYETGGGTKTGCYYTLGIYFYTIGSLFFGTILGGTIRGGSMRTYLL